MSVSVSQSVLFCQSVCLSASLSVCACVKGSLCVPHLIWAHSNLLAPSSAMPREANTEKLSPRGSSVVGKYLTREFLAFWLLGVFNNGTYVILNAGAKSIAPEDVGTVYICNVIPAFIAQLTGPYWFHLVPYKHRWKLVALCMSFGFLLVAYGQVVDNLIMQFIGIAICSFQSGYGEASMLSFSAFYDDPRLVLTGWSSGTGMAGIVGYAWVAALHFGLGLSFAWVLIIGNVFPVLYLLTVFGLLPWPTIGRETSERGAYVAVDPSLDTSGAGAIQGAGLDDSLNAVESNEDGALSMTARERLTESLKLWKYGVPLFIVYFAEYATQSGTWAAIGFPITDPKSRDLFYEYANWMYQVGVFCSRSSGLIFKADLKTIWLLPLIQVALLLFFLHDAYFQWWYNWWLLVPAFCVGLIGGAVYVGAFALIADEVEPRLKEFSMSTTLVANTVGILMSNVVGLIIERALYKYHNIKD